MAGYVFTYSTKNDSSARKGIKEIFEYGRFGTFMSPPTSGGEVDENGNVTGEGWSKVAISTLADYHGMKPGDYVFFFANRLIYGVGKLTELNIEGYNHPCLLNGPFLDDGKIKTWKNIDSHLLFSDDHFEAEVELKKINSNSKVAVKDLQKRPVMVCFFEPYPVLFEDGVDMDEVLMSSPKCFKMLRAFEQLSFIKLDDDEAFCLFSYLLKKHRELGEVDLNIECYKTLLEDTENIDDYKPDLSRVIKRNEDGSAQQEIMVEADLLSRLSYDTDDEMADIFGKWDYLSHQVVASPDKPTNWMDKMDLFGYSYVNKGDIEERVKDKFCLIEVKKDKAGRKEVNQVMKYVEWIRSEYTSGDYSAIRAFLVARSFSTEIEQRSGMTIGKNLQKYLDRNIVRNYQYGRPSETRKWVDLTLVTYEINSNNEIVYEKVWFGIDEIH